MKRFYCIVLAAAALAVNASALTITTGDVVMGDHGSNLIVNGSFEDGNSGIDMGWTPGSHLGGYPGIEGTIPAWDAAWPEGAYGWWGPLGFAGEPAPDGLSMVYFGNSFNTAGTTASIAANGVITFAGVPTFGDRPGPVTLSQTVSGLSTTNEYVLEFWTSGESNVGGFTGTGLFGLQITGEDLTYILLPSSSNAFGSSQRFYVTFAPVASTITISFLNWGHIGDLEGGAGTELVLDDVILNRSDVVATEASTWGGVKALFR
jgi:hypothetical protein